MPPARSPLRRDPRPSSRAGGRDGAWVAELGGDVLKGWPKRMRLIVRKDGPRPEPSWASPTPTDYDSPRSPPTPPTQCSPPWNCGTAHRRGRIRAASPTACAACSSTQQPGRTRSWGPGGYSFESSPSAPAIHTRWPRTNLFTDALARLDTSRTLADQHDSVPASSDTRDGPP
jgi:hypothetical protein